MSNKGSVLLIDDDPTIGAILDPVFKEAGYKFHHADSADGGYAYLSGESVDILLLDINLPGISGLNLLGLLKGDPKTADLPVIMLTVRKGEKLKVEGFEKGADDYIVKPFSTKELFARVEALLRRVRHSGRMQRTLESGSLSVDLDDRSAASSGKPLDLTALEFDLLVFLLERSGRVCTYKNISDALSGSGKIMTSENLYAHVKNLRRKFGKQGKRIETVYGVGYKLIPS